MSKSIGDADPLSRRGPGTSGRPASPVLSSNSRYIQQYNNSPKGLEGEQARLPAEMYATIQTRVSVINNLIQSISLPILSFVIY